MILSFTGIRRGMTPAQLAALPSVLAALPERVLHGGAFHRWLETVSGPDDLPFVDVYALTYRTAQWRIWHRDDPSRIIAQVYGNQTDPLGRNRTIAERCDHLLACPAEPDEVLRSGTWATVRYARAAGKSVTIVAPDGTIREERR